MKWPEKFVAFRLFVADKTVFILAELCSFIRKMLFLDPWALQDKGPRATSKVPGPFGSLGPQDPAQSSGPSGLFFLGFLGPGPRALRAEPGPAT